MLCRNQARANAWRKVEGVLVGRKISRKLKGKLLDSYIVLDGIGLETEALSDQQIKAGYMYHVMRSVSDPWGPMV